MTVIRTGWRGMLAGLLVATAACWGVYAYATRAPEPIRVGVLHSLTGTMAISEKPVVDAVLMAIDEINQAGGVLGAQIVPVLADGRSEPSVFAREAERLIRTERVAVVFGCWTSASRKAVVPVFERRDHLLFYPVQYEGAEQSPNVVYLGAAPNQQIVPAVRWAARELGTKFFIVGSDYVFPRVAAAIVKDQVAALGGEIAGEMYLPLGGSNVAPIVERIAATRPKVILNLINGDTNVTFFRALRLAGITPSQAPVISFSIAEAELQSMPKDELTGDYAAWNYFQSVDTPENRAFVRGYQARYGRDRPTGDPIEAAYLGVRLWARAANTAGSVDPASVRQALKYQSLPAPEGVVTIDAETQHAWKTVRVGRILPNGQFEVVWDSSRPVRPVPFPITRSRSAWERFLDDLYQGWGRRWVNPRVEP